MHANPVIHASVLYGFLLVLSRILGIFVFLPLPGFKAGPDAAKITLSMALTFALYSRWPVIDPAPASVVQVAGWMLVESSIGLATGLAVAFVIEGLIMGAQAISTQAGFAYASTVDPEHRSRFHRAHHDGAAHRRACFSLPWAWTGNCLRCSLAVWRHIPPGTLVVSRAAVEGLVMLGSGVFSTGIRLVLPLITLLFLIDLSMGLLGRLNSQLQLVALAFPAKMLVAVAGLSFLVLLVPKLFSQSASAAFTALGKFLGP